MLADTVEIDAASIDLSGKIFTSFFFEGRKREGREIEDTSAFCTEEMTVRLCPEIKVVCIVESGKFPDLSKFRQEGKIPIYGT